jgi:putative redox protein
MQSRDLRLEVASGTGIHVHLREPAKCRRPVVIFSHGFNTLGTEGAGRFIVAAEALVRAGYPCVLFDYRGWGYSDLRTDEMTFDTELADLAAVVEFAKSQYDQPVVILGNSLGSAVAAHTASVRGDISQMVLWCLSADLHSRYLARLGSDIEVAGFAYYNEHRIGRAFLDSLRGRDTIAAVHDAGIPCLLVHGDADTIAPVELARRAHMASPVTTTLIEIPGAGHSFVSPAMALQTAVEATLTWLNRETLET